MTSQPTSPPAAEPPTPEPDTEQPETREQHTQELPAWLRPLDDALLDDERLQQAVALRPGVGGRAAAVLVLIGERPGLSSPDSLGAYLTWAPRAGCMR